VSLSKEWNNSELTLWIPSIINHLYWSVMSTANGSGDDIVAKWTSILNHIINIHIHTNARFPACAHGDLDNQGPRKKWLDPCKTLLL
jgi:hypothetical protein